mmetsp:Transcript_11658/g.24340  ORF Transcript_11658/g.24340 Transcript_11658/m.24340 type:complete len:271 (-) Transcript_11658:455-1267(-)
MGRRPDLGGWGFVVPSSSARVFSSFSFFSHATFSPSDTSSSPPCLALGIFSLLRSGADSKVLLRAETTALALREGGDHKVGVELRWGGTPFSFFLSSRTSTPTTQTQAAAFPPRPHAPSPRSESRYLGREGRGGVSLCAPMLSLISPFLFFSLAEGGRCRTRCTVDFSGGGEDGRLLRTRVLGRGPRATTKVVARATAACCRPVGVSSFPRPSSSSSRRLLSKSWRPRRRSPMRWGGVGWRHRRRVSVDRGRTTKIFARKSKTCFFGACA